MQTEKISAEMAEQEITAWMDAKRIPPSRREGLKGPIAHLVEMMQLGALVIQEDRTMHYDLAFPLTDAEGGDVLKSLSFKPRLNVLDLQKQTQQLKDGSDMDARLTATAAALTSQPQALLKKLDTEDNRTLQAVAVFFQ